MLKTPLKILLAASIALPAFLAADLAQAGGKKHKRNNNKHHNSKSYNKHNSGHYSKRHNNYKRHYYPSYSYSGHYYGGRYRTYNRVDTYTGLAILGATLGYMATRSSRNNNAPPPQSYPSGQQDYAPQQDQYVPPRPDGFDFSQCLETRDYETTIVIDGIEQQAYGTACLLDDGTWVAGPMYIGN